MATKEVTSTVRSHFAKSKPSVQATYAELLRVARRLGPVREDPKKTSIHLVRLTAFAGVAPRSEALVLTLKANRPVHSPRVHRVEQASANRWHLEIRLAAPAEVDAEVCAWIAQAYDLAGGRSQRAG